MSNKLKIEKVIKAEINKNYQKNVFIIIMKNKSKGMDSKRNLFKNKYSQINLVLSIYAEDYGLHHVYHPLQVGIMYKLL